MDIIERLTATAKARNGTLVLPEGDDPRIVEAAGRIANEGIAQVVVLDAASLGDDERIEAFADAYLTARPDSSVKVARRLLRKPLYFAAMMVRAGDADAMVAGAASPTRRVIEAGLLGIGLAPGFERRPGHLGLVGMRERARAIGATLTLTARDGGGTQLSLQWEAAP